MRRRHCDRHKALNSIQETLSDEQWEFAKAMERYKREHHRPYPTFAEVLKVVKSLGYRNDAFPNSE